MLSEKYYEDIMNTYELKKIEIDVLLFLSHSGSHNTSRDISNFLYVSKAHISKAIEHLHHKDLIFLSCDPVDRRCVHIHITEQGEILLKKIYVIKEKINHLLFRDFSPEETTLFLSLCERMTENIAHLLDE